MRISGESRLSIVVSEGIILKCLDLVIVLVTATLAYFFGVKKLLKERELSRQENVLERKLNLYRNLFSDLTEIPDIGHRGKQEQEELVNKLNRDGLLLFQFAPDHVYKEYIKVLGSIHKGAPITPLLEFMIILRKELYPETTLKTDAFVELKGLG